MSVQHRGKDHGCLMVLVLVFALSNLRGAALIFISWTGHKVWFAYDCWIRRHRILKGVIFSTCILVLDMNDKMI